MGISEQTFFRWKKKYGGLGVSELRRLRHLEEENRQLKRRVADLTLDKQRLVKERGAPDRIQCDNGSEFISRAMDTWAYDHGIVMDFSRPGKPMDNATVESFNGSFRDECLNVNWFLSMDDAQEKIEKWRRDHNQ